MAGINPTYASSSTSRRRASKSHGGSYTAVPFKQLTCSALIESTQQRLGGNRYSYFGPSCTSSPDMSKKVKGLQLRVSRMSCQHGLEAHQLCNIWAAQVSGLREQSAPGGAIRPHASLLHDIQKLQRLRTITQNPRM